MLEPIPVLFGEGRVYTGQTASFHGGVWNLAGNLKYTVGITFVFFILEKKNYNNTNFKNEHWANNTEKYCFLSHGALLISNSRF